MLISLTKGEMLQHKADEVIRLPNGEIESIPLYIIIPKENIEEAIKAKKSVCRNFAENIIDDFVKDMEAKEKTKQE